MNDKTHADLLFEEYLAGVRLTAEYEPRLGLKRPDYLMHARPDDVLCEVEEFGEGEVDRDEREQIRTKGVASLSARHAPHPGRDERGADSGSYAARQP